MSAISSVSEGLQSAESKLNGTVARVAEKGNTVQESLSLISARNDNAATAAALKTKARMDRSKDRFLIDMYS